MLEPGRIVALPPGAGEVGRWPGRTKSRKPAQKVPLPRWWLNRGAALSVKGATCQYKDELDEVWPYQDQQTANRVHSFVDPHPWIFPGRR